MAKPDCYTCVYRKEIPGDAHSQCNHPDNQELLSDPLASLVMILGKRSGIKSDQEFGTKLNVTGNPHGIANEWFIWPFSYDPIWLLSCDGYTPKS